MLRVGDLPDLPYLVFDLGYNIFKSLKMCIHFTVWVMVVQVFQLVVEGLLILL